MELIQAVILGIIQGLTEFLPISSSGHLFLVPQLMGWPDAGSGFTAVIQLGTILAVLIYFRKDIARTLKALVSAISDKSKRGTPDSKLAFAIAVGTIPIVVAGLVLEKKIDNEFRSAYVIAGTLIFFGIVLWIAEQVGRRDRKLESVTVKDGIIIGLWQALALVPGSSRSGCTISGSLFGGMDRETAARFSFLLSIPAILLSGLYKLLKDRDELMVDGATNTIVATIISFVVGYGAIAFLMKFLQTRSTGIFVAYRIVLGIIVLVLVSTGRIQDKPMRSEASSRNGVSQAAN